MIDIETRNNTEANNTKGIADISSDINIKMNQFRNDLNAVGECAYANKEELNKQNRHTHVMKTSIDDIDKRIGRNVLHIKNLSVKVEKISAVTVLLAGLIIGLIIIAVATITNIDNKTKSYEATIKQMQEEIDNLKQNNTTDGLTQKSILGLKMDVENLQIHDENTDERLKRLEEER